MKNNYAIHMQVDTTDLSVTLKAFMGIKGIYFSREKLEFLVV
jgi:hypothetical protein